MGPNRLTSAARPGDLARLDGDMVELALLLPTWQAEALETAAQDQGLTTAQMVRRLIRDFFDHLHPFGPLADDRRFDTVAGA
jgi:hypothetical protein